MALILRGWASAQQGEFEKGIAEIQEGLEKERATGALLFESYTLGLLADACIKNERYGQAFDFLDQAQLRLDEENSERFYAAEIYRLLGETYLRSHRDLDQAEHYLCKGLKVAREQKAKSLELKLCLSIYDLYELRQNADKYRSQLGEIYTVQEKIGETGGVQFIYYPHPNQPGGVHPTTFRRQQRVRKERLAK